MSGPKVGDKMGAIMPVTPEFLERVDGAEDLLLREATTRFIDLCAPLGLMPVEVKQAWRRTVTEMRLLGMPEADGLPDDGIAFGFTARAAMSYDE